MTAMSDRTVACASDEGWARLARRSLTFLSMAFALLAAGCLVADPPNSTDPDKTPPVLMLGEAEPPVFQIKLLPTGPGQLQINVPVRSEDAGDGLVGALYVNWSVVGQGGNTRADPPPHTRTFPASTFDDVGRSISMQWDYDQSSPTCKQLTLVVTHFTNWSLDLSSYVNPADIAIATWFLNFGTDTDTLGECPNSGGAVR